MFSPSRRLWPKFIAALVTLTGFTLRLAYALNSHPFIDEFTSTLAAKMILATGLPVLPAGLFYEHGMAFSYLAAPFVGLAEASTLIILARWPSILLGSLAIPLLYRIGTRWFSPWVGVFAALMLALSPEGMVWGGRARMYALAQLLILLLAYFAFEGATQPNPRKAGQARWLAIIILIPAIATQFGTLLFLPPLLAAMLVVWFITRRQRKQPQDKLVWLWQTFALGGVIGLGLLMKRLGQPLGMAQLGQPATNNLLTELWRTISYQVSLTVDAAGIDTFLARQFGVPHHQGLTLLALLGVVSFGWLLWRGQQPLSKRRSLAYIFVWLGFGLVIVEMITLLAPFRRNPRYLVMGLPLFYLLAAESAALVTTLLQKLLNRISRQQIPAMWVGGGLVAMLFIGFAPGWLTDVSIAYRTPEPPYDLAFQYVATHRALDEPVLTVNPSAAALYLDQVDYFAMQADAEQFLLNASSAPVDRWLGLPWIGTVAQLNNILNQSTAAWFVVDTQRLQHFGFYRGDWLATLNTQMDLVWEEDGAVVYRSKTDRAPLPTTPTTPLAANFADKIGLQGYTVDTVGQTPRLTLFWTAIDDGSDNYNLFIHQRNAAGEIIAQWDRPALNGAYPTSAWTPAETIIDPITLTGAVNDPDSYLAIGWYQLDTLARLPVRNDTSAENAVIIRWPAE